MRRLAGVYNHMPPLSIAFAFNNSETVHFRLVRERIPSRADGRSSGRHLRQLTPPTVAM